MGTTTRTELILPRDHAQGDLVVTGCPSAVVLLAHGPDSSRYNPGSRGLAESLRNVGFATLLMDLLIEDDLRVDLNTRRLRSDLSAIASRVVEAVDWLGSDPVTTEMPVGAFGVGSGAAAALIAAAQRPERMAAVVACDGRADLATDVLTQVRAPVLLVGGEGTPGAAINERAARRLRDSTSTRLRAASHCYLDAVGIEDVTVLATEWFRRYLRRAGTQRAAVASPTRSAG